MQNDIIFLIFYATLNWLKVLHFIVMPVILCQLTGAHCINLVPSVRVSH
jgi:hypothetical protein